jgi:hypothetical protein
MVTSYRYFLVLSFSDDLRLHFAEAKRLLPLSDAINL